MNITGGFFMKLKHLLVAGLALGATHMAMAATGAIEFTGQVVADTCMLNVAEAGSTVRLPTVQASTLAAANSKSGQIDFTLNIEGCGAAVDARGITLTLTPSEYAGTGDNFLANTAATEIAATNVAIELSKIEDTVISPIAFSGAPYTAQITGSNINNGEATLEFSASYVETGVATPGTVSHALGWSITYN